MVKENNKALRNQQQMYTQAREEALAQKKGFPGCN